MDKNLIVQAARGWVGTKWRHQGRTKNGIDCVGLVIKIADELDYDTSFDRTDYIRRSTGIEFIDYFKDHMIQKRVTEVEAGDVLIFRELRYPYHSAIVGYDKLLGLTLVHAFAKSRKVVEEQYTDEWKRKVTHCFEFPEESI